VRDFYSLFSEYLTVSSGATVVNRTGGADTLAAANGIG
jgi:hypothetical protein